MPSTSWMMDSANFILWITSILASHYRLVACRCMHTGYQIGRVRVGRLDDLQGERPQCLKVSYRAALRLRVSGDQLAGCSKQLLLGKYETAAHLGSIVSNSTQQSLPTG
ncbi:hypothetical protein J3F84DRAFT_375283 [Trichoderma pleuroticola]